MTRNEWITLAVVVVVVVLLLLIVASRARARRRRLQEAFGREYDVAVSEQGSKARAQQELERRQQLHDQLDIRPLSPGSRARYLSEWETLQARFVDRPQNAVAEADELISAVMTERGYPPASFEDRAANLSVEHSGVLQSFRTAHDLSTRAPSESSTEDLRRAMVEYRRLFADLVGDAKSSDGVNSADGASSAADERDLDAEGGMGQHGRHQVSEDQRRAM